MQTACLTRQKTRWGIESPSKRFRDEVGVYMAQGIGVGFEKEMPAIAKRIEKAIPTEFDIGTKVNVGSKAVYDTGGNRRPYGSGALAEDLPLSRIFTPTLRIMRSSRKKRQRQFRMIAMDGGVSLWNTKS